MVNRAIGGRSSRTFFTEGRWQEILDGIKPGDFVLIQFGHNDVGPLDERGKFRGSVKGIGPKFEKLLKAEGITEVRQIAEWTDADVEAISKKIGVRRDRIRREDWIGRAKRVLERA